MKNKLVVGALAGLMLTFGCTTQPETTNLSPGPYIRVLASTNSSSCRPTVRVCISEEPYLRKIDVYHGGGEFLGQIASPANFIEAPYVREDVYSFVDGYSGQRLDDIVVKFLPISELTARLNNEEFFTEKDVSYEIKK